MTDSNKPAWTYSDSEVEISDGWEFSHDKEGYAVAHFDHTIGWAGTQGMHDYDYQVTSADLMGVAVTEYDRTRYLTRDEAARELGIDWVVTVEMAHEDELNSL